MYKEYLAIDESAPVVYSLKFEACLQGSVFHLIHPIVDVCAISVHCAEEIVGYVEAQNSIFGVAVYNLLAIGAAVLLVKLLGCWQQIVGIEG